MLDDDVNVNGQAETIPGVNQEIPGVDGTEEEIRGMDEAEGTPGMDDTTSEVNDEVDDEATQGLDDDAPDTAHESDEDKTEQTHAEHESGAMHLHRQPRKEFNRKNYDSVFNITDETKNNGITPM